MHLIRSLVLALICALCLVASPVLAQQTAASTQEASAPQSSVLDYDDWREFAQQAEDTLDGRPVTNEELAELRAELVVFRTRFLAAQDANQSRIASLREQIAALGPPPEEGATEAPEISARRAELAEQLSMLQAPGIAAQEAFRRADGLIRQIDTTLRERDAEALLSLWPSPVNPVNWVAAADAVWGTSFVLFTQVAGLVDDPARMREFRSNLPVSLLLLLVSGFVLIRGRRWIEQIVARWLSDGGSRRGRRALARLVSLTQIIVPVTAVFAISAALELSSVLGTSSDPITSGLLFASIAYFTARWAGRHAFPVEESRSAPLQLPGPRRREGRFWANMIGAALAVSAMQSEFFPVENNSDAANAVLAFPVLAFIGLVLVRIGMLMNQHNKTIEADKQRETSFIDRMTMIMGKALMLLGAGAPIFAAIGYVQAAQAGLYAAVMSLGLIVLLLFLMQLFEDIYCVVTNTGETTETGLIPSLFNFFLVILSLPAFALIWGMRPTELLEFWQMLRDGFRIGDTRIAPTNILSLILVFSIGYMITRVFQGALESSILPKTKIDKGGQKAIISGTGYIGIFVASLVAISSAGLDLSNLALLAGALSVGIGFGLQNIVSNFISGVILLIERPVAEGDWIEVGGTMGTVRTISVRSTVIETFDRTDVIVPNADLIQGNVTNWTRYNSLGRITIPVGVAYGSDTRKVARILKEIGEDEPLALIDPAPQVHFVDFGADALEFELRMVLSDVSFGMSVRTELRHQIAERFKEEGIEIPFAQRDIWLRNPEALRGDAPPPAPEPPRDPRDATARTEMVQDDILDTADADVDADR